MKGFNFKQVQEDYKSNNLKSIVKANIFLNEILSKYGSDPRPYLRTSTKYTIFEEQVALMESKEFTWEKYEVKTLEEMRELTNFGDLTNVGNGYTATAIFSQSLFFQKAFSVSMISSYMRQKCRDMKSDFNNPSLYIKNDLLQMFFVFHLQHDYRFHSKIDSLKIKSCDSISRMNLRMVNQKDPKLHKKYFNLLFDLKEFVYFLLDEYFPTTTNIYVEIGQYVNRVTLQIVEFMFQIGLWEYKEIHKLMKVLMEKSENLTNLENNIFRRLKKNLLSIEYIEYYQTLLTNSKEMLSKCIIHSIVLVNDHCLDNGLALFNSNNVKDCWKDAYFSDRDLNNVILNIIMNYLLSNQEREIKRPDGETVIFNAKSETIITCIQFIMMFTSPESQLDICSQANDLVSKTIFTYFNDTETDYVEKVVALGREIQDLVDDIALGELGNMEELKTSTQLKQQVEHVTTNVINAMKKQPFGKKEDIRERYVNTQIAFSHKKVVMKLLTLLKLLDVADREDLIVGLMDAMVKIFKDNYVPQNMLFSSLGGNIFNEFNANRPLIGILFLKKVYKKDRRILYQNSALFKIIFGYYENSIKSLFKNKDYSWELVSDNFTEKLRTIVSLHWFNLFFIELIKNHGLKEREKKHYHLMLQDFILPIIDQFALPILSNKSFLPKNAKSLSNDAKDEYHFDFKLTNPNTKDMLIMIERDKKVNKQGLLYEIAISFLRLFLRVSMRLIYGETFMIIRRWIDESKFDSYEYLLDFEEGLAIRAEILRLYQVFFIFPSNHIITNRSVFSKGDTGHPYDQNFIEKNHINSTVVNLICKELGYMEKIEGMKLQSLSETMGKMTKSYILRGILPMMFKYVSGIKSLFYITKKTYLDVQDHHDNMTKIFHAFMKERDRIERIVGLKFKDSDIEIKDKIEMKNVDMSDYDADEIAYHEIYETRRKAEILMEMIESIFPEDLVYQITRLKRYPISEETKEKQREEEKYKKMKDKEERTHMLARDSSFLGQTSPQGDEEETKLFKNKRNQIHVASEQVFINKSKIKDLHYKQFKEFRREYKSKKKEMFGANDNIFFDYLKSKNDYTLIVIDFIIESIMKAFKDGESEEANKEKVKQKILSMRADDSGGMEDLVSARSNGDPERQDSSFIVKKFFEFEFVYPYIIFFDNLINGFKDPKECIYFMCVREDEDSSGVYKDLSLRLKSKLESIEAKKERNKKFLSIIHYLTIQFALFSMYKTFVDDSQFEIWDKFFTISNVIKNFCENNSTYFKRYLNKHKSKLNTAPNFNPKQNTILVDLYDLTEMSLYHSLIDSNNNNKITLSDRPELFRFYKRMLEVVGELINGPCPFNQRTIYKDGMEKWNGILNRVIDDVNDPFYDLKDQTLEYFLSLFEGEGSIELDEESLKTSNDKFICTRFISWNVTSRMIVEKMFKMLKKLAMYRKMKNNPKFTEFVLAKVKENRKLQYEEALKEKEDTESSNENGMMRRGSVLLNPEKIKNLISKNDLDEYKDSSSKALSVITDEMLDTYRFEGYAELLNLYKVDNEFSDHVITSIALRMYSMLEYISRESKSTKMFLDAMKIRISQFYKEQVDLDDVVAKAKEKDKHNYDEDNLPESYNFLMFILKISKKIEIRVKAAGKEKWVVKEIYFPLMPSTFFLEDKSKALVRNNIDLDNRKSDFQKNFKMLFQEMEGNHDFSKKSYFFYSISRNDVFTKFKFICWIYFFFVNLLCLFSYHLDEEEEIMGDRRLVSGMYGNYIFYLSVGGAIFTSILFTIWLMFRFQLEFNVKKEKMKLENRFLGEEEFNDFSMKLKIGIMKTFKESDSAINFFFHSIFVLLAYLIDPVFHTFHLMLIINISETAQYIVRATTAHFNQLFLTFVVAIFLIYSFSVLNANYYSDSFDIEDNDVCKTLLSCFLTDLNLGLRNGGGVADSMKLYLIDNKKYFFKLVFDVLFFIVINVVSLNIIFGIIIDTFGEMRTDGDERSKFYTLIF